MSIRYGFILAFALALAVGPGLSSGTGKAASAPATVAAAPRLVVDGPIVLSSGSKQTPLVVDVVESDDQVRERKASAEDRQGEATRGNWSVVLAVIGGAIAFVQLMMFQKQLTLTRDALTLSKEASGHAELAAQAAKTSADAMLLVQRAWICFADVREAARQEVSGGEDGKEKFGPLIYRLSPVWKNAGQTPALIVRFIKGPASIVEGASQPMQPATPVEDTRASPTVLAPAAVMATLHFELDEKTVERLERGEIRYAISATAFYETLYEPGDRKVSRLFLEVTVPGRLPDGSPKWQYKTLGQNTLT